LNHTQRPVSSKLQYTKACQFCAEKGQNTFIRLRQTVYMLGLARQSMNIG